MATNKERIEALEAGLGGVQDGIQRLEDTVNRLSEILLSTRESSNNHNNGREGFVRPQREENDSGRQIFSSKWQNWNFQNTLELIQQNECEDFDEALSKVRQIGSLRDYQKEFERLGNRVHGWSQKALIGSFMGGLRSEISETIRNINDDSEADTKEAETDLPSDPEISLHALTGWTATKTMRVTAKIGTHDVVVLIDSGSTHNFISDKVAALLHLPVVPTAPFHVRVANG
ncbi:hypothetical protein CK203_117249 [Vitis vinifera]|uniref:Retrotransposon gag domain-containing protein n=1 Tax=Vitis vinifera TaxID=29760 RepID=A0A438FD14_VITVI|nr:hypothetical protein CK203_117249 [Vitis vinifera]